MRISDWSSDVCSSDLTLDLYAAKARAAFVKAAGLELGEAEDVLKHDLGRVLLKLEECQEAEIAAALAPEDRAAMSAAERAEAMALLTAPDLMDRILADFALCGVVGEAVNIQTGYLDRKSVVSGKSESVRVDLGGGRNIKKKN